MMIMDLQLFSEIGGDEDYILPDDFQEDATETATDEMEDTSQPNEDQINTLETPVENENTIQEQQEQQLQTLKIKYNKEEREIPLEEAIILAQKGMNYEKLQERLNSFEANPGLQYLNELAQRSGFSIEDMVNHWRAEEQQQELNTLVQKNIPQEYAQEILENRKFRNELQSKQQEEQKQLKQNEEFKEFFDSFPDAKPTDIPAEVWQKNDAGVPLKYAFMEHQFNQLKNDVQALKKNQENFKKAPIKPTNTHGTGEVGSEDDFLQGFNSI